MTSINASTSDERIDLAVPSTRWHWKKPLRHTTVLQSFAFDDSRQRLYVVQVMQGGIRLAGESREYTGTERRQRGDMCLNQLDFSGKRLGHMYLLGHGHGVGMGVERDAAGATWIWTESDGRVAESGAFGRGITRFRFVDRQVRRSSAESTRYPVAGSTANQPSVDMSTKRIAVRHRIAGKVRYRVFSLGRAVAGDFTKPLHDFAQAAAHPDPDADFQGFALHGNYLYQLAGDPYGPGNPPSGHGNTYVSCIDISTGKLIQRSRTEAGYSLDYREPEGLAVRRTTRARLCMGFASGGVGERRYSIYYKERR
ncbi:Teichoic acid biosynthesis protein C (Precursor) [Streptomyces sp. ISL-98]|uniref:phage baseplate protein n=1 Tax=Streptomyces sp. ISL-98 TaxID=2819192 RepID=UPI001BE557D9|nr:Teichoic acid biosynthesis protein C (Precursor) [Streptomyces sp. ISL-98]MBT2508157.1 Teichoic acid biosynthesis protein C (Precursor) [Streptomyces sp. ISL-98]